MKNFTNKNLKIKESLSQTRLKRKNQSCKVFDLKINSKRLNKQQKEDLKMLFVESKWLYNAVLNYCKEDILNKPSNYKLSKMVNVKNKEGIFEERELKHLAVQSQQTLITSIISSIKMLSTLKKKGYKVGPLKFKSEYNVVHLKQFGCSHKLFIDKNLIKIQGVHKRLKVFGLNQMPINAEFANAKLIQTADGYHLKITCYFNNENLNNLNKPEIGIDFGCSTNLTLSNGEKINYSIEESERLKRLQRKLEFTKKGSNNRKKIINAIRKEFLKINYKKNDAANKIVHDLLSKFSLIAIQNDQLNEWSKNNHGQVIQHSILGRIKSKLKESKQVYIVSQWEPTTQTCFKCGFKQKLTLNNRVYHCPSCGYENDRDINAALNILKAVPTEHREVKAC